jgi:hypothetical protein
MLRRRGELPRGTRWLAGGLAAVVLALVVAWVLFVLAADWLAHHDVGSVTGSLWETALDNARGRLLTLGAGLVAAGALIFTALNFNLLWRNSEKTDLWQRRTHELTEQGQVTDRYTKAVEQLGSDKLDVRIGGIYALERIARDSARDHPVVMEVLTAFIREHSHEQWPLPDSDGRQRPRRTRPDYLAVFTPERYPEPGPPPAPPGWEQKGWTRPDVQAAVTVIGRRDKQRDLQGIRLDLIGVNLTGADLSRARLAEANLFGADLSGARFRFTDLVDADLSGSDLTRARLFYANITDADLHGALLTGAELAGAHLVGAILAGADLTGASLYGANLERAVLHGANLTGANLTDVTVTDAQLDGAQLDGALWPSDTAVPEGWRRDASGRLERARTGSGSAEAARPSSLDAQKDGLPELSSRVISRPRVRICTGAAVGRTVQRGRLGCLGQGSGLPHKLGQVAELVQALEQAGAGLPGEQVGDGCHADLLGHLIGVTLGAASASSGRRHRPAARQPPTIRRAAGKASRDRGTRPA